MTVVYTCASSRHKIDTQANASTLWTLLKGTCMQRHMKANPPKLRLQMKREKQIPIVLLMQAVYWTHDRKDLGINTFCVI